MRVRGLDSLVERAVAELAAGSDALAGGPGRAPWARSAPRMRTAAWENSFTGDWPDRMLADPWL